MTLSRTLPLFVLAAVARPAQAEPITAEAALKNYREHFQSLRRLDCPRGEEIVVCGWRKRELAAAPYVPAEGDSVGLLPGEPPGAGSALAPMCTWDCKEPPKGGLGNIVKGIAHLLGKDD